MRQGIRCSYWEKPADTPAEYFIDKVKRLGFDVLELEAGMIYSSDKARLLQVSAYAADHGVALTLGGGSARRLSLCDPDPAVRKAGIEWRTRLIQNMRLAGIQIYCGPMHAYWPIDFRAGSMDKQGDRARSVESLRLLGQVAADYDVTLCVEAVNRFENHILNTAAEGVDFLRDVGNDHVKLLLDTFHMNIEEDSIAAAIRTAGSYLGHFHTGESNRRVPGKGHLPWRDICEALVNIDYTGAAVMEPFVRSDGATGQALHVFHMLVDGGEEQMDSDAREALAFLRNVYDSISKAAR